MESKQKRNVMVEVLEDKKAKNISTIDIQKISTIADHFVICTGTSTTHIKSLVDAVDEKLSALGVKYFRREGYESARWILADYGDVILHVFHEEDRRLYDLERLWSDGLLTRIESDRMAK